MQGKVYLLQLVGNEAAKLNVGNSKKQYSIFSQPSGELKLIKRSTLNCIDKICWNHRFDI